MPEDRHDGWDWMAGASSRADPEADAHLAKAFARCFAGTEGDAVLCHLRGLTLDRVLGPSASVAELRHLDGQRCLYRHIETLIARGRTAGSERKSG